MLGAGPPAQGDAKARGVRVLIAGGGTAGHVFPAIALAQRLAEAHGADVRFVGTERGLESRLVLQAGFAFTAVEARPFVGKPSWQAVAAPAVAIRSVRQCRPLAEEADVVVGMGGYVSVPTILAAARTRSPVVLHEQNAVPGMANRTLARIARVVALSFAESVRQFARSIRGRTVVTGNPVRETVAAVRENREALRKEAWRDLGLEEGRRTIVVFGGSQGALHVNEAALGAVRILEGRGDLQVLLLTGPAHLDSVERRLPRGRGILVRALAFLDRMDLALAAADLVVARSGATTIAEVTCCRLPSVLIPYPHHRDRQQELNARAVQRAGGASLLLDEDMTPRALADRILWLVDDEGRLREMAEHAAAWARPDAAEALAKVVQEAGAR